MTNRKSRELGCLLVDPEIVESREYFGWWNEFGVTGFEHAGLTGE